MVWIIWGGFVLLLALAANGVARSRAARQVRLHGRASSSWIAGAVVIAVLFVVGLGVVAPITVFMVAIASWGSNK